MGVEALSFSMKLVLLSACLALPAAATPERDSYTQILFAKFQQEHNKEYKTRAEHNHRFNVFAENVKKINEHNSAGHSYQKGINQFSDLTDAEFKAQYLGGYKGLAAPAGKTTSEQPARKAIKDLPASVDWRDAGAVTDVKNQGQCGSCWAFATTEMIESYAQISSNEMVELSTQQVTSCTPNPTSCGGVGGCKGSIAQLGYNYIQLFGHTTEESWPYVSGSNGQTGSCDFDMETTAPVVTLKGYNTLPPNNQEAVMNHLATVGPLAVNVDASLWHTYTGGIFDGCDFNENIEINHVVQLVGYTPDAWIIRNSWSEAWGEEGYIRLAKTVEPGCGTDSSPLSGTGCAGGPGSDVQHVCGQCGMLFDASYPLGAENPHAPRK